MTVEKESKIEMVLRLRKKYYGIQIGHLAEEQNEVFEQVFKEMRNAGLDDIYIHANPEVFERIKYQL